MKKIFIAIITICLFMCSVVSCTDSKAEDILISSNMNDTLLYENVLDIIEKEREAYLSSANKALMSDQKIGIQSFMSSDNVNSLTVDNYEESYSEYKIFRETVTNAYMDALAERFPESLCINTYGPGYVNSDFWRVDYIVLEPERVCFESSKETEYFLEYRFFNNYDGINHDDYYKTKGAYYESFDDSSVNVGDVVVLFNGIGYYFDTASGELERLYLFDGEQEIIDAYSDLSMQKEWADCYDEVVEAFGKNAADQLMEAEMRDVVEQ